MARSLPSANPAAPDGSAPVWSLLPHRMRTGRMRASGPVSPSNPKSLMSSRESLQDDKVLIQTSQLIMERTESYVNPEIFKFQVETTGNSRDLFFVVSSHRDPPELL